MKSSFKLGTEAMPIVLDQTVNNCNSGSQENFNILDLVHKPAEYNVHEENFAKSLHLDSVVEDEVHKSGLAEDNKKDWSLKYVPDIYCSDKLSNFSYSVLKGKENDVSKDDFKKCKKKLKTVLPNSVNMQENFQNGELSSPDIFVVKQSKIKQTGGKCKKVNSNKLKEKINGIKRGFKPIAPYPSMNETKIGVNNSIQKLVNSHINPILIVKIDDHGSNEEKQKMSEFMEYNEGKVEDTDYVHDYNIENFPNDLEVDLKNKKNYVIKTKCYKCCNCSFMTLSKDFLDYHYQRKQKCFSNDEVFHCPGCRNIFYSMTTLRVHLVQDHKMVSKEVKAVLQDVQEVQFHNLERGKSSCVFESNQMSNLNESMFHPSMNSMDLPLSNIDSRDEIDKSFDGVPSGREIDCISGKRQTMLETYLDDINSKADCNMPPTLNHNGSALLENTFK